MIALGEMLIDPLADAVAVEMKNALPAQVPKSKPFAANPRAPVRPFAGFLTTGMLTGNGKCLLKHRTGTKAKL